ncbi:MAG: hypothetical protein ACKPKO_47660, partial [Candidatus Fonsibacter sp.]
SVARRLKTIHIILFHYERHLESRIYGLSLRVLVLKPHLERLAECHYFQPTQVGAEHDRGLKA